MTELNQVYRCNVCGNMTEVVHQSGGTLSCCGQAMEYLEGNTVDAAVEKHVPVVEKIEGGYKVSVGEVAHPMLEKHYIEWIELVTPTQVLRKILNPDDEPVAVFMTEEEVVAAREYCNLHGHWKS